MIKQERVAKDTVMNPKEIKKVVGDFYDYEGNKVWLTRIAQTQAEISFKAGYKQGVEDTNKCGQDDKLAGIKEGIRMYAWWKDGIQYVGTCGTTLERALAEIDKEAQ